MLLVATTRGWNVGDDMMRDGALRLLGREREDVIYLDRAPYAGVHAWTIAANRAPLADLVRYCDAIVVAGTPEWGECMGAAYELCLLLDKRVWLVGVGDGDYSPMACDALKRLDERGMLRCTVRDPRAGERLAAHGVRYEKFLDVAFHCGLEFGAGATTVFNPKLRQRGDACDDVHKMLFDKLSDPRVIVHNVEEVIAATELLGKRPMFNDDYKLLASRYDGCRTYVGGRLHGAILAMLAGGYAIVYGRHRKYEIVEEMSRAGLPCRRVTVAHADSLRPASGSLDLALLRDDFAAHAEYLRC